MVYKPKWFRIAPMQRGYGKRTRYVVGFDSEAVDGEPFLMQFAHPDGSVDRQRCNAETSFGTFVQYLEELASHGTKTTEYIVVGWNLRYEYTQLFRALNPEMFSQSSPVVHVHYETTCSEDGKHEDDGWDMRLRILNDKRYAFTIELGKSRRRVRIIDGMAFFSTSLEKVSKMVPGVAHKLDRPANLTTATVEELLADDYFLAYADQDAITTQQLGELIVDFHARFDIPITISAPQFSSFVFRRAYLDDEIPRCDEYLEHAGLRSYHGGKNGLYIDRPAYYADAFDYDVNGAYTSAMMQLPDPVRAVWSEDVYGSLLTSPHALWYVRGRTRACIYRAAQETSGRWLTWQDDGVNEFWITSYELAVMLEHGEVDILEASGFVMDGPSGGSLQRFCQEMAYQKRHGKTAEERLFAKFCLNSLYGKTIQKVPNAADSVFPVYSLAPDGTGELIDLNMRPDGYKAGGLYHPGIASLITGYVRAMIHRLEHKYGSLMTSTDGLLSLTPPDASDIGQDIGALKVHHGSLRIWRERLYYFESDITMQDGIWVPTPEDERIKEARHGFQGSVEELLKLPLVAGVYEYNAKALMVGLRDSLHEIGGKRYGPGYFVGDVSRGHAPRKMAIDLTQINTRSPLHPSET